LKAELFDYDLPDELIARHPAETRDGARLLVVNGAELEHRAVRELPELVPRGALVVVNDTRVRRARVFGKRRPGGGQVELFLLERAKSHAGDRRERWRALGRANKPLRRGTVVDAGELEVEILASAPDGVLDIAVRAEEAVEQALERLGRVPIPPYLGRSDEPADRERYQTVYADRTASVAAPTAGLHLSHDLLVRLAAEERCVGRLTLEVGLGTFRPVTVEDLDDHPMHAERVTVSEELTRQIRAARARHAPVVAIGTTVVRALESAADPEQPGEVRPFHGETRLLIQPGYRFRVVDALFTNFHQPRSTLLALVSAFAGHERVLSAYAEAVRGRYRFLSYGDAMWLPACAAKAPGAPAS
jgi:S-adenosylmethionine:tRNA ribosyltransferase-isomerase